ncbi:InlB B-repeat-containing protein, partial [Algibacter sp.]
MKTIVAIFMLFSIFRLSAQSNTVAVGVEATGSGGTVSFTGGDVFYTYKSSGTGSVTEGVQQSYFVSPTGVISGDATVCSGVATPLSIVLTGVAPWSGTLSDGTVFSGSDNPLAVSVSPTVSTTYTIATLIDGQATATPSDLSGSAVVTVNLTPATPIISAGSTTTFCDGENVVLTSSSAAGNQWYKGGVLIADAINETYIVTETGSYTVITKVLDCTSEVSLETSVTVNALPMAGITNNTATTILTASTTAISVTATGGENYSWTGGTSPNTATNSFTAAGTYTVTVTNTNGCVDTQSITILFATVPDAPTNLVATGINTGGMIQFTVPISNGGADITNYEYSLDGGATWVTPTPAITESPLIIPSGLTNCTEYQVQLRAVNAAGPSAASVAVTLTPAPSTNPGEFWTTQTSAADNNWTSVTYGNGLFVAVARNSVMTSPDGMTWTAQTSAADNYWSSITYGNGLFVAVARNSVMTSPDGMTWTAQTSAADNYWSSITYGNGLFVAVARNSVMTSPDGMTWTAQTSAADNYWSSITYGNGLFVAVSYTGNGNRVMTSPDGITWTSRSSAADNSWTSVTYGNSLFVAMASTGTARLMTSPDGVTWTSRVSGTPGYEWSGRDVTYGNGLFVAVTDNNVMTSTNGIYWESQTVENNYNNYYWRGVTYGNGYFVAVSYYGRGVMTSTDGINWVLRASAVDNNWNSITYGNSKFVAVSSTGTGNRVMTSSFSTVTDAVVISTIEPRNASAVVNFSNTLSANATPITNYEYSTDEGASWTARFPASAASHLTITGLVNTTTYAIKIRAVSGQGTFCASSAVSVTPTLGTVPDAPTNLVATPINTGGIIAFEAPVTDGGSDITNYEYSIDGGVTWLTPAPAITESPLTIPSGLTNCTDYQVQLRAVNAAGPSAASVAVALTPTLSNNPGADWTAQTSAADNNWTSVTYGNGLFVAVASINILIDNAVMTSPDGITWTAQISSGNNLFTSVTYGNGLFVAVGNLSLMTSPDGITWTSRTAPTDSDWRSVTYGNGLFVAVSFYDNGVMTSPDGVTWTSRTSPYSVIWKSVTYGNGLFVAVSSSPGLVNSVMTSPDGITWTARTSTTGDGWESVTYGNSLFVAVAYDNVMTSPDGITWTAQTSATNNYWNDVTYGNGMFVAVSSTGTGNRAMTSPDGMTWTSRASAVDNSWNSVTYGNGQFVAVSTTGTGNRVMSSGINDAPLTDAVVISTIEPRNSAAVVNFSNTLSANATPITNYEYSTDNGVSWTARNPATAVSPLTIIGLTNNTTYAIKIRAVNGQGTFCASSAVSVTPTLGTVPDAPTNLVATGIHTGGIIAFEAPVTDGGSDITNYEYSVDGGVTWLTPAPAITESPLTIPSGLTNCTDYQVQLRAVNAAGPSAASVAVALTPTLSNNPGADWTSQTSAADNIWNSITYGNSLFVAIGNNSVMTSPDGITWASQTAVANNWTSVTYGNGLFVAVSKKMSGNLVMTSPDGITWTSRTPVSTIRMRWLSVTYGNGLFVAVAITGNANRVMTSPDGITWTAQTSAADNLWNSVTYGNGLFVAVSSTGTSDRVMTSPDGITWTAQTSAVDNNWSSITYGNGHFVAVSSTGTSDRVMTSPDGITWTAQTSAADNNWSSVTYGNGQFVAVSSTGASDRVMTSPDGITWTSETSATDNYWNSVTYGNGKFVAVSSDGTGNRVMTSSFSVAADAPVITSASINGTSATVNFTQTVSELAPAISNYEYSTDSGSTWISMSPATTTSPLTINGLPSVISSLSIRAVNSVGASCASNDNYLDISFNANGGTGTMADQAFIFNDSANLTLNAFTRIGYTFTGWNTAADGSGTSYADGANYTMNDTADVTLFAAWTANNYTVTFDSNDSNIQFGTTEILGGEMSDQTIAYEATENLTANAFIHRRKIFAGWATTPGGAVAYADGASYTMSTTQDVVLYAKWATNNSVGAMQIFIRQSESMPRYVGGIGTTITLDVDSSDAIASVKNQILNRITSVPGENLVLVFAGTILEDGRTLADYEIQKEATLQLRAVNLYPDTSVEVGGIASVLSVAAPDADYTNKSVSTTSDFTGTLSILPSGEIKIENASPLGSYVIQVNNNAVIDNVNYSSEFQKFNLTVYNNSNTVVFNANGGTGSMAVQSIDTNTAADLTANAFTRTGYTFAGWNTAANGSGISYSDEESYTMSAAPNVTLYAQWVAINYTVTFDVNGGTGTIPDQSIAFDVAANLTANSLTRAGYSFTGWNTDTDGIGTSYANEASYTMSTTQDVVLYAKWATNNSVGAMQIFVRQSESMPRYVGGIGTTITLDVDSSDAIASVKNQILNRITSVPVENLVLVFAGTILEDGRTLADYAIQNESSLQLRAVNLYPDTSVEVGGTASVLSVAAPGADYTNKSVSTTTDFTGTLSLLPSGEISIENASPVGTYVVQIDNNYNDGSLFQKFNLTVYNNSNTVVFNANGGSGTMAVQSIDANTSTNLTTNTFTRTGYTFAGWNQASNGSGTSYSDEESYTMSAAPNVTLYAQWIAINYTVTFDANGGTGTMSGQSIAYEAAANLTSNSLTRAGYSFTGWNTAADGSVSAYADGANYTMTAAADVTLYAQWVQVPTISAGGSLTFCEGENVVLTSSSATGNQWYKGGALIANAIYETYTATETGVYTVKVTTAGVESAASAGTSVTVNPIPATPTISEGGSLEFCEGDNVVLMSSSATGNQWYKDGVLIAEASNETYTAKE